MKFFLVSESNKKYVCADDGVIANVRVLAANREAPGPWETYYAVGIEWSADELKALAQGIQPYLNAPPPSTQPPPVSTDPASVPFAVYATGKYDLATKAGCCAFTEEVARQLHAMDADWGHVKKSGAQEKCTGGPNVDHAVDAVFNKRIPECRDIIVSSGAPGARPGWNITGTPSLDLWAAPK